MASAATPQLLYNPHLHNRRATRLLRTTTTKSNPKNNALLVFASQSQGSPRGNRAPPGVDTRIHWENEDEGWIGGSSSSQQQQSTAEDPKSLLGEKFADLLSDASGSHYE